VPAGCRARRGVRNFFTINKWHAFGAPGRPAPAGLVQWARTDLGSCAGRELGAAPQVAEVAGVCGSPVVRSHGTSGWCRIGGHENARPGPDGCPGRGG